jgi:antitoxin (DNA-binding transcriptional repressor) of toxin-antitoxin stability system
MIHQIKQKELPKKLWDLIEAAIRGEPVFITWDDQSVVQLIPLKSGGRSRKAGSAKGIVKIKEDFDAPLSDFSEYMP